MQQLKMLEALRTKKEIIGYGAEPLTIGHWPGEREWEGGNWCSWVSLMMAAAAGLVSPQGTVTEKTAQHAACGDGFPVHWISSAGLGWNDMGWGRI